MLRLLNVHVVELSALNFNVKSWLPALSPVTSQVPPMLTPGLLTPVVFWSMTERLSAAEKPPVALTENDITQPSPLFVEFADI